MSAEKQQGESGNGKDEDDGLLWPNLYEETRELLCDAGMMYPLAELRIMAREGKLDNDAVLQMPLKASDIYRITTEYADNLLLEFHGPRRHDTHLDILELMTDATKSSSNDPEQPPHSGEIILFDDTNSETELVYAIRLDHTRKRVVVAFRGSVTRTDFVADAKALPMKVDNPVANEDLTFHMGFHAYLFDKTSSENDNDEEAQKEEGEQRAEKKKRTKYEVIMKNVKATLEDHPDYRLFVTGHSLGGALCTLFSFYAAVDPDIVKPVTCISFASPKLGTLSFRTAVQHLEKRGQLRFLRVANYQDPVTVVPRDPFLICPHDTTLALFCLMFKQYEVFRHVGVGLMLYKNGRCSIFHAKTNPNYCRTLLSDWVKTIVRIFYCLSSMLCFYHTCCKVGYRMNHGYPEYWNRLKENATKLQGLSLNELYDDFWKGDTTTLKTRYW